MSVPRLSLESLTMGKALRLRYRRFRPDAAPALAAGRRADLAEPPPFTGARVEAFLADAAFVDVALLAFVVDFDAFDADFAPVFADARDAGFAAPAALTALEGLFAAAFDAPPLAVDFAGRLGAVALAVFAAFTGFAALADFAGFAAVVAFAAFAAFAGATVLAAFAAPLAFAGALVADLAAGFGAGVAFVAGPAAAFFAAAVRLAACAAVNAAAAR